jgi:hypothetical protein
MGMDTSKIKKMYQNTFLVEFSMTGEPKKYFFDNSLAVEDEHYFRDMINSLQFVVPSGSRRSWETTEEMSSGLIKSAYKSKNDNTFEKKRIKHLEKLKRENPPVINQSLFSFKLNKKGSWISNSRGFEKTSMGEGSQLRITTYLQTELDLRENDDKNNSFFGDTRSFDEIANMFSSEPKNEISAWDNARFEANAERLKNATVSSILQDLKLNKISPSDAVATLKSLFAMKKNSLTEASNLIHKGNMPAKEYQLIFLAMAQLGSQESQGYLVNFIETKSLPFEMRVQAAMYTAALKNTSIGTAKTLETLAVTTRAERKGEISNTIILALGAMCADNSNSGAVSADINTFIKSKLESGLSDVNETNAFLAAVGNTGNSEHIPVIEKYVNNKAPVVRLSAVEALHSIEGKEADTILISVIKNETNGSVVTSALTSQLMRQENTEITKVVISRLEKETEPNIKLALLEYLHAQEDVDSTGKTVLEKIRKGETNPRIIVMINKILNARPK